MGAAATTVQRRGLQHGPGKAVLVIGVDEDSVVTFPNGIPGFEQCKRFGMLALEEEAPFLRLLSIDQPNVGFVLLNPC